MKHIIDSHVHLHLLHRYNPDRIPWLVAHGCSVVSWAFGGNITSVSDLKRYLHLRRSEIEDLRRRGLDCYHLCGIHPRKIPPDLKPEDVADLLAPFLEDPLSLGIGEIGLEAGTPKEQEIFRAQLEFGLSLERPNLRFGIHTPRQQKKEMTERLLGTLASYEGLAPLSVIDHCTSETIGPVLSAGYHAGISLSRTKSSEDDLIRMMENFSRESDRIMCNTDSSTEFYEDLVLIAGGGKIEKNLSNDIFWRTASRFFGIPQPPPVGV